MAIKDRTYLEEATAKFLASGGNVKQVKYGTKTPKEKIKARNQAAIDEQKLIDQRHVVRNAYAGDVVVNGLGEPI